MWLWVALRARVCLLNLEGSDLSRFERHEEQGWPKWTVPVLKWCKEQGGVTGYPPPALHVALTPRSTDRLLGGYDMDSSGGLSSKRRHSVARRAVRDNRRRWQRQTAVAARAARSADQAADRLPNSRRARRPRGVGAMEIFISTAEGVCDFIQRDGYRSRIPEWNTWYHLMNCGFPLKLSGETDFPCMSSRRVGQGRVYVQLGDAEKVDYSPTELQRGIAAGRSYVSDGFAHALKFNVDGQSPGFEDVALDVPRKVAVKASVAFAPETPIGVAYGNLLPTVGRRMLGDTVNLHAPRSMEYLTGGKRKVEIIVNGRLSRQSTFQPETGAHDIEFSVEITQSSWVAPALPPTAHEPGQRDCRRKANPKYPHDSAAGAASPIRLASGRTTDHDDHEKADANRVRSCSGRSI